MAFNHRKKRTIRRKQRISKRKSAKTYRRRRVRIMIGGRRRVWKVIVYGIKDEFVVLYHECIFSFDDTINENDTEIKGNLFKPGVIDVELRFKQVEEDKSCYRPALDPDKEIMIKSDVAGVPPLYKLYMFRRIPTSDPIAAATKHSRSSHP